MDDHSRVAAYLRQNGGTRLTLKQERRRQHKLHRQLAQGKRLPRHPVTAAEAAEQAGSTRILQRTAPAEIRWSKKAQKGLEKTKGAHDRQLQRQLRANQAAMQSRLIARAIRMAKRGRG